MPICSPLPSASPPIPSQACRYGVRGGFIAREENKTLLDQLLRHKASVPGVGAYAAEVVEDKLHTLGGQVRYIMRISTLFRFALNHSLHREGAWTNRRACRRWRKS